MSRVRSGTPTSTTCRTTTSSSSAGDVGAVIRSTPSPVG
jgi:hypothetical protein